MQIWKCLRVRRGQDTEYTIPVTFCQQVCLIRNVNKTGSLQDTLQNMAQKLSVTEFQLQTKQRWDSVMDIVNNTICDYFSAKSNSRPHISHHLFYNILSAFPEQTFYLKTDMAKLIQLGTYISASTLELLQQLGCVRINSAEIWKN